MSDFDEAKIYAALRKEHENLPEEIIKYRLKRIEEEMKRRKKKGSIAEDPKDYGKGRHLGEQDIGDISYSTPWQKHLYDDLGIAAPINDMYKCPVCGYRYALDMPPDRCFMCGTKSFLHLRKMVNLKA